MEPIKKIMVLLDMSDMDKSLLQYSAFINDVSTSDTIYFVNIVKNMVFPAEVKKEFPDIEKKALDERKEYIKQRVTDNFLNKRKTKIRYHIKFGAHLKTIITFAEKESIDLIIIGQKRTVSGTGVLAQRLARRASCNLLIVPENSPSKIDKLLVPVDFSLHAKLALEQAVFISEHIDQDIRIICQNVFNVPVGYHYTGKSYKEFAEVMKDHAQKNYEKFIKRIDTHNAKIETVYSLDTNDNLASDIQDLSKELKVDGIIIGAKGRTAAAALFLGSLSEKLINSRMDVPLMVVRPKGKNVGLLESLKEI